MLWAWVFVGVGAVCRCGSMFRRFAPQVPAARVVCATPTNSVFFGGQFRGIFADKLKVGAVIRLDKRVWRLVSTGKSQKGQGVAQYHLKFAEINTDKKKEIAVSATVDFPEVRYERVKLLFSGFDDDDNACFVYPQHSNSAGKEVNLPATKLQEHHQKFLACGMPVDLLHIIPEEDDGLDEIWGELNVPTNYEYTVEKLTMKGLYKMAVLKECDGMVSVSDVVQPNDRIKVIVRPDGTASFNGKVQ